ncbi:hypothetical protein D3C81_1907730 [compost metagenome]
MIRQTIGVIAFEFNESDSYIFTGCWCGWIEDVLAICGTIARHVVLHGFHEWRSPICCLNVGEGRVIHLLGRDAGCSNHDLGEFSPGNGVVGSELAIWIAADDLAIYHLRYVVIGPMRRWKIGEADG